MDRMTNSLKFNVFLIPEEGQHVVFSEGDEWFKEYFQGGEIPDFVLEKVDVDCWITKTSNTVFVKGSFSAQIKTRCSRCLEDTVLSAGNDFSYTLLPAKVETREELELKAIELEESYYDGDFIDLKPMICEQIILQIPMKVLCREQCRGLCPQCGENLNFSHCGCTTEVLDGRMAQLKNVIIKSH